jgi:excisionase family DNA binding protein
MNTVQLDPVLSRKEAAKALSVHRNTIIRLEQAGKLRRIQVTEGRVGYRLSEINRYLSERGKLGVVNQ